MVYKPSRNCFCRVLEGGHVGIMGRGFQVLWPPKSGRRAYVSICLHLVPEVEGLLVSSRMHDIMQTPDE